MVTSALFVFIIEPKAMAFYVSAMRYSFYTSAKSSGKATLRRFVSAGSDILVQCSPHGTHAGEELFHHALYLFAKSCLI